MPRLLQINTVANYGSTGKIMENIGLLAENKGWESYIATGSRYSLESKLTSYKIVSVIQSQISAVHSILTDHHGFSPNLINPTKEFIKWIENVSPDIIHMHNIHSYILHLGILFDFLHRYKRPVIWTLHDCWAFTGHCSHYARAGCNKWQTGCHNCQLRKAFPKSLFIDHSAKNYTEKKNLFNTVENLYVTTVSDWLGEQVAQSFLKDKFIGSIYNGIDTQLFHPKNSLNQREKIGINKTNKLILGVSTDWCEAKGLTDFVKLRQILPQEYQIVLLGMSPAQINSYAQTGIICLPRTENIETLVQWYSTADVLVQMSYAETFGLPVVEGFACGTPAIVYDNTALSCLVDNKSGLKVPTGDIEGVAKAIKYICQSNKVFYSEYCRGIVLSKYNKEQNYTRYIDLYNKLLAM